jgi:hypothetical protein
LRRHFGGCSSAAGRGLRPDAAYVLACTRSRSLALAWEAWLHKAYRPPYAAKTPAKRPRKPPHPPPGWYTLRAAVYEPARPPPPSGHERSAYPPPELRTRARAWDGVRDGGPSSRVRRARPRVLSKRLRIHRHSSVSKLCPAAWAYDLQVQTCRYFFTGVIRPVSLYLWGPMCGGRGGLRREVKSLQFIMHSGIYHGHG